MPQLLSRMDELNWLTPSIAEILEQGPNPPGGDGSIRSQIRDLQARLNDLETPARVINVRPTPSYTLFIVRPEAVGRRGNRKNVTANDIKRSLGQIAEERKDWKIGFLPKLNDIADAMGILLRTDEHRPLSLRRLLVRTAFRDHASTLAFTAGNTLEQRLIVEDLAEIGNLLVIGTDSIKRNFINSLLTTLIALNTPGELRVVIAGGSADEHKPFINTPHALSRSLDTPELIKQLIDGLVKEMESRREWMDEEGVPNIAAYNHVVRDKGQTRVPRIVLVINSLSDQGWQEPSQAWMPELIDIIEDSGRSGIHLILVADQPQPPDLPEELIDLMPVKLVTRTAAAPYISTIENFHGSLMRFIDAVLIQGEGTPIPVELCAITESELHGTVEYWQQIGRQRQTEARDERISGKTGVTQTLRSPITTNTELQTQPDEDAELLSLPDEPNPLGLEKSQPDQRTQGQVTLQQAQALAAYLGWISIGPLQDILGMSPEEAKKTITVLKTMGIVEENESATPRFIRAIGGQNEQ